MRRQVNKEFREFKEFKEFRESKEFREFKEFRESKEFREFREFKEFRESKEFGSSAFANAAERVFFSRKKDGGGRKEICSVRSLALTPGIRYSPSPFLLPPSSKNPFAPKIGLTKVE